jgi:hypothetical protein
MASSRKIVAEFVGVFLIGGLAGGLLTCYFTDTSLSTFILTRTTDPAALEARIEKIKPLIQQMTQDLYKTRHEFGVDIMGTLDRYHSEMAAQMTPEHRAAYEAKMMDRRDKLRALLLNDPGSPNPAQK